MPLSNRLITNNYLTSYSLADTLASSRNIRKLLGRFISYLRPAETRPRKSSIFRILGRIYLSEFYAHSFTTDSESVT